MSIFDINPSGYRPPRRGLLDPEIDYAGILDAMYPAPVPSVDEILGFPPFIPAPPPAPQLVNATGWSGRRYVFRVYKLGDTLPAVPGVYIFCMLLPNGDWYAIYVGEADDLSDRVGDGLWSHEKCFDALMLGATHIAITATLLADKVDIETDLRWHLDPPLNRQ